MTRLLTVLLVLVLGVVDADVGGAVLLLFLLLAERLEINIAVLRESESFS